MKTKNLTTSAVGVLILGVIISLIITNSNKQLPVRTPTDDEKSILVTVEMLADFGYTNMPRSSCETWVVQPSESGITEVEYEYDSDKATAEQFIYMSSGATCEPSVEFAEQSFDIAVEAVQTSAKIGKDARVEEKQELFSLGDESYSAHILIEDSIFGNIVVVRKGRVIHSLIVTGIYFDQQQDLEDLFFQALENSSPQKFASF